MDLNDGKVWVQRVKMNGRRPVKVAAVGGRCIRVSMSIVSTFLS